MHLDQIKLVKQLVNPGLCTPAVNTHLIDIHTTQDQGDQPGNQQHPLGGRGHRLDVQELTANEIDQTDHRNTDQENQGDTTHDG